MDPTKLQIVLDWHMPCQVLYVISNVSCGLQIFTKSLSRIIQR